MIIATSLLLFLHIVGAALVFGIWVATFSTPRVLPLQFFGALLQLVTGLALWGLNEPMSTSLHIKLGVKLLITVAITVAAFIGQRKTKRGEPVSTGLAHSVGGLALVNIALATLWH